MMALAWGGIIAAPPVVVLLAGLHPATLAPLLRVFGW